MLAPRGGRRPGPAGASGRWGRRERDRFERTGVRNRAGAVVVRAAPGQGRSVDVAGIAESRSDSRRAGLVFPEDVQPLRRGRRSARPMHRLRTLPGGAGASRGLPALRGSTPRGRRGRTSARRFRAPALRGMHQSTSSVRSSGRTVELCTTAQQPHPPHEVSPGTRRGDRARAAPRA